MAVSGVTAGLDAAAAVAPVTVILTVAVAGTGTGTVRAGITSHRST